LKAQSIIKLANLTSRFSRYKNPFLFRIFKKILKWVYPIKKQKSPLQTIIAYDQGLINIDTGILGEYKLLFSGQCEPAITQLIKRTVSPGDVCLDIGANIGALTLVMAFAAGKDGRIIAFEPHPRIRKRLHANIDLNRLENIQVVPAALTENMGRSDFYIAEENFYHQGRSSLKQLEGLTQKITVPTINGKMLHKIVGHDTVSFIKIDVEGHDCIVLKEIKNIVSENKPHIVFEFNKNVWNNHGCTLDDALDYLFDFKYTFYLIKNDLVMPYVKSIPDSCDVLCVPQKEYDIDVANNIFH